MDAMERLSRALAKMERALSMHLEGESSQGQSLLREQHAARAIYSDFLEAFQLNVSRKPPSELVQFMLNYLIKSMRDCLQKSVDPNDDNKFNVSDFLHEVDMCSARHLYTGSLQIEKRFFVMSRTIVGQALQAFDYTPLITAEETPEFLEELRHSVFQSVRERGDSLQERSLVSDIQYCDKQALRRYIEQYWESRRQTPFDNMFYDRLVRAYSALTNPAS